MRNIMKCIDHILEKCVELYITALFLVALLISLFMTIIYIINWIMS